MSETEKNRPEITNLRELQKRLCKAFDLLEANPQRLNQTTELANTAGKILDCVKVELAYCAMRGEEPQIPFVAAGMPQLLKMTTAKAQQLTAGQ